MTVWLLDVNVWVALAWPLHARHAAAQAWFDAVPERRWASCPLTQAAFVRLSCHPGIIGEQLKMSSILCTLVRSTGQPTHEFWPADLPLPGAVADWGARLGGPQQVNDAYLLGLAIAHGGILATFDQAIPALLPPASPHLAAVELLTSSSPTHPPA